ncbi:hypothetical protein CIHG_08408 [Coccidioides immitis H538.4]|uniref:4a-hydroxytetrahydrobiopterin dehydratase n=1 Tax=Coccidioides immitis H538.4 TaxID=396776 RepID=A0A0J8S2E5_COCIT|nr:hypothetical protein CIHG_08408 [Coccidioides immitis H538.4]
MAVVRMTSIRLLLRPHIFSKPTASPFRNRPLSTVNVKQSRPMSLAPSSSGPSSNPRIQYSEGCDPSVAQPELEALLSKEAGRWELCQDAQGIKREYRFKSFKKAWAFMSAVAEQCSVEKHHPEWTNVYNRVSITWTTHRPRGLSLKDLRMARFCDEQASLHEEIVVPPPFPEQSQ